MTDKLPPLLPRRPGQFKFMTICVGVEAERGHWYGPEYVAAYIAVARREVRSELLATFRDPDWAVIDEMTAHELAAYQYGVAEALGAVLVVIDGKDTGEGACNEPWATVRAHLVALVAERAGKLLVALTDEQIEAASREGVKIWQNTTTKSTILPSVGIAMNRFIVRAGIAEFCRINELTAPGVKP